VIDHLTLRVRDYPKSKRFYELILAPLGYQVVMKFDVPNLGEICGIGEEGKPTLWLAPAEAAHTAPVGQHLAFRARDHQAVEAFHRAALAAGGRDEGAPGPRPHYHPHYYGAFAIDPDGQVVEAVCHAPQA
jgi:catechol 2,3-dioxygenase-like lactoylglutathione lyase family enzyme